MKWRRRSPLRRNGPMYRTERGGSLVFTAEDFENMGGGSGNPQQQQQNQPQPTGQQQQNQPPQNEPDPRFEGIDDIEIIGPDGNPVGNIPRQGNANQQQQPTNQQQNVLDMVLEGDNVPQSLRGKKVSDLAMALSALERLQTQPPQQQQQPQNFQQPQPQQQETVQFTEEDFGVGADPAKFQQKLTQMLQQFTSNQTAPLQLQNMAIQSMMLAERAKSLPYYEVFKDEIEADARNQQITSTANPYYWTSLHDRLVRENIHKVMDFEQRKNPPKPQPMAAERLNGTSAQQAPGGGQRHQLTVEELRICQQTGIDPREYIFYRDNYR